MLFKTKWSKTPRMKKRRGDSAIWKLPGAFQEAADLRKQAELKEIFIKVFNTRLDGYFLRNRFSTLDEYSCAKMCKKGCHSFSSYVERGKLFTNRWC